MDKCIFCDYKNDKRGTFLFDNEYCVCMEQNEEILIGSCLIIPKEYNYI